MSLAWSPPGPADRDLPLDGPRPVDACLVWDRLTRSARHPDGDAWPVIVELPAGSAGASAAVDAWTATLPEATRAAYRQAFAASLGLAPGSVYQTALLPDPCEAVLLAAVEGGALVRFQIGARCRSRPPASPPALGARMGRGSATHVLGVIDDGCCFAHEDFRPPEGCRVRALWDQSPAATPGHHWRVPAEGGPGYGVEMLQAELDRALRDHSIRGEAGERALYQAIDRPEWGGPSRTHGARVMHLMAGRGTAGTQAGGAGTMPVIFVQLPRQTVADTSGDSLGLHVLDGARYIVARARQLDPDARVTINISLGSVAGPHDGSSLAECALSELARDPRVSLVMAAGNTAGADARVHASQRLRRGTPGRFVVRVPPALRRHTFVEFWVDDDDADDVTLEVTAPGAVRSLPVGPGQVTVLRDASDRVLAMLAFVRRPAQGKHGALALLALAPTQPADPQAAPVGFWSVAASASGSRRPVVHAWVERDDEVIGARRPQQVRFENPTGADDDHSVDDEMTLSNLSNADRLVVVGGYVHGTHRVAAYSANGPRRGGRDGGPTHYAPSDRSDWVRGVAVPGFFSGTHSAISGTSAAAPQIARALAEAGALRKIPDLARAGSAGPEPRPPRPARQDRPLPPGTHWLP